MRYKQIKPHPGLQCATYKNNKSLLKIWEFRRPLILVQVTRGVFVCETFDFTVGKLSSGKSFFVNQDSLLY